jgi:hypothetical protein
MIIVSLEAIDAILSLSGRTTTGSESIRTIPRGDSITDDEKEKLDYPDHTHHRLSEGIADLDHAARHLHHSGASSSTHSFRRRPRAMSEPWSAADLTHWATKSHHHSSVDERHHLHHLHHHSPPRLIENFFDRYATIYNKNGRIGIYTKEVMFLIVSQKSIWLIQH